MLFWNTALELSNCPDFWLRSASTDYSDFVWVIDSYYGYSNFDGVYYERAVRAAFQIDLSKIDFTLAPPSLDKGTLITINLDGTDRQYRILKNVGSGVHEVLSMEDLDKSTYFNNNNENTYSGGELDTYLNTTWYNTLSDKAKTAIVPKNIT